MPLHKTMRAEVVRRPSGGEPCDVCLTVVPELLELHVLKAPGLTDVAFRMFAVCDGCMAYLIVPAVVSHARDDRRHHTGHQWVDPD